MRILLPIISLLTAPLLHAVEWSIDQCSSLDLLAGRTGIADVRPSNDPHHNSEQMMEQNSGIYRGQWSWQSEMPELLYEIMHTGEATKASPSGFTALQAACVYADEAMFQALLEAGADINSRPADWQQLGYVGDTPLGLLVRFMNARTAAARVRMARVLLERGADPDAPMTTWKGNRVVTVVPFCELGNQDFNHELRLLLLQSGDKDLSKRTSNWQMNWEWYRDDLVQFLQQNGVARSAAPSAADAEKKRLVGRVPLLDLIRKGDVEGVRLALEAGASIEVSPRARRYGQEPLFNIPVRRKDSPEAAVEIARLLIDAGADIHALNRRGRSLRIHYDRYRSKASRALCAYLKSRGAFIHPDAPENKKLIEEQAAARKAAAEQAPQPVAEQPQPEPAPQPAAEQPQPEPAPQPVAEQPQPEPAPQPVAEQPQPEPAPQPVAEQPQPEPAPQPAAEQPQPEPAPQPVAEQPQPEPAKTESKEDIQARYEREIMLEVQQQLQVLRQKYVEEQHQREQESQQKQPAAADAAE